MTGGGRCNHHGRTSRRCHVRCYRGLVGESHVAARFVYKISMIDFGIELCLDHNTLPLAVVRPATETKEMPMPPPAMAYNHGCQY
jgi:hypothetical protein